MDEVTLISTLQSHLASGVSSAVRTSGLEDEYPMPVVIIDDWDTNDLNLHNSAFAGESGTGADHERYLNFDFRTRVEFLVRHSDEVDVVRLKDSVKQQLRLIRENPQQFHEDLKQCQLGAGGNPTYQFTEPKEAELMLSARFYGDHTITRTPSDTQAAVIERITDTFTFNP